MIRKIRFNLSGFDKDIVVSLLEEDKAGSVDALWNLLSEPQKLFSEHTMSTGDYFSAHGRPARNPVVVGLQTAPAANTSLLLSELEPGWITYAGGKSLGFPYGKITEPLMARGPVVAKVAKEDLDDYWRAGRHVWQAQFVDHKLVTITVSREEG